MQNPQNQIDQALLTPQEEPNCVNNQSDQAESYAQQESSMSLTMKTIVYGLLAGLLSDEILLLLKRKNLSQEQASDEIDCPATQNASIPVSNNHHQISDEINFLYQYTLYFEPLLNNHSWSEFIEDYIAAPNAEDSYFIAALKKLGLTPIEMLTVSLTLMVEFDVITGRILACLQKPLAFSRPTLGLLNTVFAGIWPESSHVSMLNSFASHSISQLIQGRAFQLGLLKCLQSDLPLPEQSVITPLNLAIALTQQSATWPGTERLNCWSNMQGLSQSVVHQAQIQAAALAHFSEGILVIHSVARQEAVTAALIISEHLRQQMLLIHNWQQAHDGIAVLLNCHHLLPVLILENNLPENKKLPEIVGFQGPIIVIAGVDEFFACDSGQIIHWQIPYPNQQERKLLWSKYITDTALVDKLSCDHIHAASRIETLGQLAQHQARIAQREYIELSDIRSVAWLNDGGPMSGLAEPIRFQVDSEALVVRKQTRQELDLLKQRCMYREHLADNLGITFNARYQMGVKGLLVGPSGTGKTLAASWLASEIGLPLYRVDLASVTSKYIGETEKNLAKLLTQAEKDEIILLFDEADSMFGKRTDVKDANDRFANAQTNYLLQRIESYKGIVLLTSNSKTRFDEAFIRRLDAIIEFAHPEPSTRRAIWLKHLGTHHQLTTKEINQVAVKSDLTGGHIRNAVLAAAVLAKSESTPIQLSHIIQALTIEYRKLGKQISPELAQLIH
ncbi:ATP-binding protein [Aliikangiella maris]|uniref:ATP-binding protein n=2 Tax=Aliikangiella maris TaxID=3162458 RepID=A0ABV3MKK3_9GAMM